MRAAERRRATDALLDLLVTKCATAAAMHKDNEKMVRELRKQLLKQIDQ